MLCGRGPDAAVRRAPLRTREGATEHLLSSVCLSLQLCLAHSHPHFLHWSLAPWESGEPEEQRETRERVGEGLSWPGTEQRLEFFAAFFRSPQECLLAGWLLLLLLPCRLPAGEEPALGFQKLSTNVVLPFHHELKPLDSERTGERGAIV